ncbi:SigE family RNA polymerase sigma factor [Rugosimonospora africana]|uniref:DNA-directed RNA polymerase sigma-70 factor n=1 Tax=Rugosimonospora africana TaxID=556532 RepID=A0A8J3VT00_9ACTN|nr:SigE family RNA polymerase sigma factor [Rugosimonospora africana]GIH17141.1 DNA-directed RNA polymerase sigma-70 factor [Rugosimonospora africana]
MGQEPGTGFDDFVRGRAGALLRSAYLLTGDRHAAEDLLQDALERVYRRWSRIATSPEAYARRALVNGATNRWRLRRRRPEAPLIDAHDPADPDHAGRVALRAVVENALRELPARQRATVVLRYFDDLSEAEVASLLNCSVGTVKTHASRGLARLRTALGPTFDAPVSPSGRNS